MMQANVLQSTFEATIFKALQDEFLKDVPTENRADVTKLHQRQAKAFSKIAGDIVSHIQQNLEAKGTATVSTTVTGVGAGSNSGGPVATAVTGSGTGTATLVPGSLT